MTEHRRRILDMLAAGKITADEADQLLSSLPDASDAGGDSARAGEAGKYLRIEVLKPAHNGVREKKVNIRVPVAVVRSGLKLGSLLRGFKNDRSGPHLAMGGFNVDWEHFDGAQLDALLGAAGDVTIDVDDGRAKIRVVRD